MLTIQEVGGRFILMVNGEWIDRQESMNGTQGINPETNTGIDG
jgi:hypothetical protein